ncbi:MAG: hypothetical protein WCW16_03025 [Candidatus Magasanikbacteria bacterium]
MKLKGVPFASRLDIREARYDPLIAMKLKSINSAIFLSNLIFHHQEENLGVDDPVVRTIYQVYAETAISRYKQETVVKNLKEFELIRVELLGIPARRHFFINYPVLHKF